MIVKRRKWSDKRINQLEICKYLHLAYVNLTPLYLKLLKYGGAVFFAANLFVSPLLYSEDSFLGPSFQGKLGGSLTLESIESRAALQAPAPNLASQRRLIQIKGFSLFHQSFTKDNGLGPYFVNRSCANCHVENAKGPIKIGLDHNQLSTVVVKVELGSTEIDGSITEIKEIGEQLQDSELNGTKRFNLSLAYIKLKGRFKDGQRYTLRKPIIKFKSNSKYNNYKISTSLRMSPILIGLGLVEAIPTSTILTNADPEDLDHDGISGKAQVVPDLLTGKKRLGRFGFKASHPSNLQQIAKAFFSDLGITNPLFSISNQKIEITLNELIDLNNYLTLASVPAARNYEEEQFNLGLKHFSALRCAKCHTPKFVTGIHADSELVNQEIYPFSDFLLHDLGKDLADNRPEFQANHREWRTTPLWGLGFTSKASSVKARYLHDGRARSIEEAIIWHGGEARFSKDSYLKLRKAERDELIYFLNSL